jgi:drug/metabolite transporter (DMT)-like permease
VITVVKDLVRDRLRRNAWFLVLLAFAFGGMGYFTGWLVGQSRTPAIPALLPLVIGLLGGFSYAVFEKRVTVGALLAKLEETARAISTSDPTA